MTVQEPVQAAQAYGQPVRPTVTYVRRSLRIRAAVSVDFELAALTSELDPDDDVLDFVDEDCERVLSPGGSGRWTLKNARRTETLTSTSLAELQEVRSHLTDVPETPLQEALDRSIRSGWSKDDLARLNVAETRALAVVAQWWRGTHEMVPAGDDMSARVDQLNLFADIRAMANDHFVGRENLLGELREHFSISHQQAFVLHGLGGVGKSATLARHVVWALDERQALVAVLDFDDVMLNPYLPADLVDRIVRLVAQQIPGAELARLTQVSADVAATSGHAAESSSKTSTGDDQSWSNVIDSLLRQTNRPILVLFDTFEQVQRRGPSAVSSILRLIYSLEGRRDRISVVISGRAEIAGFPVRSVKLCGLERSDALWLLRELTDAKLAPGVAEEVVDLTGTSPLTVRLAARLLSDTGGETGELFALDFHAEQIDADLYRRILGHIKNPAVEKLAHPGLILRRITADLIDQVLVKACKISAKDGYVSAERLFDDLANEPMLVEPSLDSRTLIHRPDIRALMLPQLLRDKGLEARRIELAAIKYYVSRTDRQSKIEELYHRLRLGQKEPTLKKYWDERAALALVQVMDEFPVASRIYLASRLPETYLGAEDRRLVDDSEWIAQIEPQVRRLLSAQDLPAALGLLSERRGPDGASLLPGLEIEALEASGHIDDSITIARDQRRRAAGADDLSGLVTFSLHLARLLEQVRRFDEASAVLDETLGAVTEPSLDRLRTLTAWLGLSRRLGHHIDLRKQRQLEAISLGDQLGPPKVRSIPGLLRDLAAEVGERSLDVVNEALRALGLDAHLKGVVPAALKQLDHLATTQEDAPAGMVADLARVARQGDQTDWDEIFALPRGETGDALSEVLTTFADHAHGLQTAVVRDYQREADVALLGEDLAVELGSWP